MATAVPPPAYNSAVSPPPYNPGALAPSPYNPAALAPSQCDGERATLVVKLHSLRRSQRRTSLQQLIRPTAGEVQSWGSYIFAPPLYILNFRAGVWHLLLTLFSIGLKFAINPVFVVELNKMWSVPDTSSFPDSLRTTKCCTDDADNETCKIYDDVFEFLSCIRPKSGSGKIPLYTPSLNPVTEPIPLINLIILFELITFICHFWIYWSDGGRLCAGPRDPKRRWYSDRLLDQLSPLRWLEYSVTASIMFVAALALSRVSDVFLLASLFTNSFFLNFVGGNCFEMMNLGERKISKKEGYASMFRVFKWICFFSSWVCFVITIATFWDAYFAVINPYFALETGELWGQLFNFVTYANIAITVDFSIFPLIHLYQFAWPWKRSLDEQVIAYARGETAYIWASFLSKTMLTMIIGSAALMRRD
tara:strand:- start:18646 stop:19905 length:1260 start_codon:yes stop_codon:yes gene_type:complete